MFFVNHFYVPLGKHGFFPVKTLKTMVFGSLGAWVVVVNYWDFHRMAEPLGR